MSVIATAVKHLLAAGITGDALVQAIAEMESCLPGHAVDTSAARRRAKDAAYQAEKRAARRRDNRQNLPTSADSADAPSPNDIYSNPLPLTPDCSDEQSIPNLISIEPESPTDPVLKPEHVVEAWNEMAGRLGLSKAKLTPERRKKLASRVRCIPVEDWTEAIAAVERAPFLRGENSKGWRANFDFLLQPTSFTKLIEGTYDGSAH